MKFIRYFGHAILVILILSSNNVFAQTNEAKLQAKWKIEKYESEKNTPQSLKAQQDLEGLFWTFGDKDLEIAKRTLTGDSIIKKGPYSVSGNNIILGKDQASILLLTKKNLTIKTRQGVFFLNKM